MSEKSEKTQKYSFGEDDAFRLDEVAMAVSAEVQPAISALSDRIEIAKLKAGKSTPGSIPGSSPGTRGNGDQKNGGAEPKNEAAEPSGTAYHGSSAQDGEGGDDCAAGKERAA